MAPSSGCRGRTPTLGATRCAARRRSPDTVLAGTGASGSVSATAATEERPSGVARIRVSPRSGAKAVHTGLGLLDGDIVGQGAPPALRGSVIGLLHHALAVAAPRRADATETP